MSEAEGSRVRRALGVLRQPGVVRFGLPFAVASSVWRAALREGVHWSSFASLEFAERLAVSLVITGIGGGLLFQWLMARLGMPLGRR